MVYNMKKYYKKHFKKIFIIIFFFFIFTSTITAQQYSDNKSEIELRKAEIELNKLIYEEKFFEITFWIKTLVGIFGGIAVIWTIYYGFRTISQWNSEQKLAKISSLLESSSSKSENIRLAAINGLIQYIDNVIDEMLIAISTEESDLVRKAIENALYKINDGKFNKVVEENNRTLIDRACLIGRLTKAGVKEEEIAARLMLTSQSIKMLRKRFKVIIEYGNKIQKLHMERQAVILNNDLNNTTSFLFKKANLVSRLAESTGKVIARRIRNGQKIEWPKTGLDLSETNLYRVDLRKINASYSIFSNCIMRHSNLKDSILFQTTFYFANLFHTCLDNANLEESDLKNCNLRHSFGRYANFYRTDISEAIFSEGDFSHAKFLEVKNADKVKFRKSTLIKATFKDCKLTESEFHKANFESALLEKTEMFRSILIKSDFRSSTIRDVKFNGADLRSANFKGAEINNVDFRGANVKNADFRGANIENVNFEKCKGFNEAIF